MGVLNSNQEGKVICETEVRVCAVWGAGGGAVLGATGHAARPVAGGRHAAWGAHLRD